MVLFAHPVICTNSANASGRRAVQKQSSSLIAFSIECTFLPCVGILSPHVALRHNQIHTNSISLYKMMPENVKAFPHPRSFVRQTRIFWHVSFSAHSIFSRWHTRKSTRVNRSVRDDKIRVNFPFLLLTDKLACFYNEKKRIQIPHFYAFFVNRRYLPHITLPRRTLST